MGLFKSTLVISLAIFLSVGLFTFQGYQRDRMVMIPTKNGIFVYDRQTDQANFCTESTCRLLQFDRPMAVTVAPAIANGRAIYQTPQQPAITQTAISNVPQMPAIPSSAAPSAIGTTGNILAPNPLSQVVSAPLTGALATAPISSGAFHQNPLMGVTAPAAPLQAPSSRAVLPQNKKSQEIAEEFDESKMSAEDTQFITDVGDDVPVEEVGEEDFAPEEFSE